MITMDSMEVQNKVEQIVTGIALRAGFDEPFRRKQFDWGFDGIITSQINVSEINNRFSIVISLARRIDILEQTWEDFAHLLALPEIENTTFTITTLYAFPDIRNQQYSEEGTGWIGFPIDEKGYEEFQEAVHFIIESKLIPTSIDLLNVNSLDNLINSKIELESDLSKYIFSKNGLVFRRLGLAKLSGNKKL